MKRTASALQEAQAKALLVVSQAFMRWEKRETAREKREAAREAGRVSGLVPVGQSNFQAVPKSAKHPLGYAEAKKVLDDLQVGKGLVVKKRKPRQKKEEATYHLTEEYPRSQEEQPKKKKQKKTQIFDGLDLSRWDPSRD